MGVAFPEKPRIIGYGQLNECLQGGVEFPTGGTVRDRAFEKAPADSVQLRDQRLQSGWKKMCVKQFHAQRRARTSFDCFITWKA